MLTVLATAKSVAMTVIPTVKSVALTVIARVKSVALTVTSHSEKCCTDCIMLQSKVSH